MYEVIVIQKSYQWNFFGFLGCISPKTLLKESYPVQARQVWLTIKLAGKLLHKGRS